MRRQLPTPGEFLQVWREASDLRQTDLAKRMGASLSTVCLVENNKRHLSFETGKKMHEALGLPSWLLAYLEYYNDKMEFGYTCFNEESGVPQVVLDAQKTADEIDDNIADTIRDLYDALLAQIQENLPRRVCRP